MSDKTKIVVPLFEGVTQLDFTGPCQLFAIVPDFELTVASIGGGAVRADGLTFSDLADLREIESCDVLCVPGGSGTAQTLENTALLAEIARLGSTGSYLTSVCTGSLILAAAGLVTGRRVACHWAFRDLLSHFGAIPDPARVVRDGNVITGGGVTAGIDFALTLIAELRGAKVAQNVQLGLEYSPAPPFSSGRPETAPASVLAAFEAQMGPIIAADGDRIKAVAERMAA